MPSHIWSSFTNITNNRDLELKLEMLENTSEKELENYGMDGGGVNNHAQLLDLWNQPESGSGSLKETKAVLG